MKATSESQLLQTFCALQMVLSEHAAFWRRSPFHHPMPDWAMEHPALVEALLALPQDAVARLSQDNQQLWDWLRPWLPTLSPLSSLCEVPGRSAAASGPDRFFAHVSGGKRAQVESFAAAVVEAGTSGRPWIEWCAGKGHLGRWLGHQTGLDVLSVEWSSALCASGRALAARSGVAQVFECMDVHSDAVCSRLSDRHAVALHACGDLHRRLIQLWDAHDGRALDFVPCCYDRTQEEVYRGLNPEAELAPDRLALRLAVTDMRAGRRREHVRCRRELGWKLAYKQLRAQYAGIDVSTPLASVPRSWAQMSFPDWCRSMAHRDGFKLPAATNYPLWARKGESLRYRFERINLPRLAFRRGLEMWLVLDLALHLSRRGHRVSVSAFCSDRITPRNLMISAR
ncbi:MAG: methyltransferase [Myxococcota bacterium]